jgi:hypothetical protein
LELFRPIRLFHFVVVPMLRVELYSLFAPASSASLDEPPLTFVIHVVAKRQPSTVRRSCVVRYGVPSINATLKLNQVVSNRSLRHHPFRPGNGDDTPVFVTIYVSIDLICWYILPPLEQVLPSGQVWCRSKASGPPNADLAQLPKLHHGRDVVILVRFLLLVATATTTTTTTTTSSDRTLANEPRRVLRRRAVSEIAATQVLALCSIEAIVFALCLTTSPWPGWRITMRRRMSMLDPLGRPAVVVGPGALLLLLANGGQG